MGDRKNFGKLKAVIAPPDMIDIQTMSYLKFLQKDESPSKRKNKGLQAVFKEVFPIESYDGRYIVDFVKYELSDSKLSALECLRYGSTYAAPLRATFRLQDGEEVREEAVFMGEIPLMTDTGAFVVNGAERVVVSQLHRSPGICSESSLHTNGKTIYSVRVIPDRGSWIEIQFDTSDLIWVFMDRRRRRRKFLATTFLRAIGYSTDEELLGLFYEFKTLKSNKRYTEEDLVNLALKTDLIDIDSKNVIARKYDPVTVEILQQAKQAGFKTVDIVDVSWDGGIFMISVTADPNQNSDVVSKSQ